MLPTAAGADSAPESAFPDNTQPREEHKLFWKRVTPLHTYKYIAVLEIEERTDQQQLYGKRTYRFKLADGTYEERTFEDNERRAWQDSILNGGVVINPDY